ncbi:hypothetical protein G6F35_018604 [Rhizopus arrhizus]|nr:hypothetical protein G6F35_018604 [Rhizopus arrhizus]
MPRPAKCERSSVPSSASTRSPVAWPWKSLMCLKWSMSSSATQAAPDCAPFIATASSSAAAIARRLGRPVSASVRLCSARSAFWASSTSWYSDSSRS